MNIKRHILIILSIILVLLSFTSCSNDELVYSCNKEINELVKKNFTQYSSITREEWLKLPDSLKIPVYRTFSVDLKYEFWQQKREELLSLEWSYAERAHINVLYDFIKKRPQFFSDDYFDNEALLAQFENFIRDWYSKAYNDLGWSRPLIYYVAVVGHKLTGDMQQHFKEGGGLGGGTPDGGTSNDCGCSQTNDWCDLVGEAGGVSCKSHPCNKTSSGCGWFWSFSCNGICKGNLQ